MSILTTTSRQPNPDDLLVLLAVARSGRFTTAAETLGVNHTTISRRIAALERDLGGRVLSRTVGGWELSDLGSRAVDAAERVEAAVSGLAGSPGEPQSLSGVVRLSATDGFSAYIAAPAVAELQREHPNLTVEIVTVTRPALQHRSGLDIEVVVGEPHAHRAEAIELGSYILGMYASKTYLHDHGTPTRVVELAEHPLVYFIDSMLQVDALDAPRRLVPTMKDAFTATNVFVHVEATRAGAGIGFLPCFMADRHADLVRLLPDEIKERLPYWMVVRPDSLRQPSVAAVANALRTRTRAFEAQLLGRAG
ncbi:DNA-binding transcriptional LysR family regulator [Mycetocola sp. CAN_C7]|uniref:LysR family transcriptional regulator n=1 Tax=Mycetocola sp. CAN_C7 TaxID=2787724 RepID=UPI0018C9824D